jgi:carboxyl-terminal processing protease
MIGVEVMALTDRKKIFIGLLGFLIILIGTNAANYYFFGSKSDQAVSTDEPTTIIRYEPGREIPESDAALLWDAIDSIKESYFYPVETEALIEGAVRGMIDSVGDPHLRFYDPDDLDEFMTETRGSYGGIGVRIIEANQSIVIFETFPGSPADRVGIAPGDRILEADGNELTGEGLGRAVELLRGPSDTTVDVLIMRPGAEEPISLTVAREEIQVTTISSRMLDEGLGYIKINSFDSNTAEEFTGAFRAMEQGGLGTGLILDLRNNPGGLVDQAVEVAKLIVPEGEIVRLVGKDDQVKSIYHSSAVKKPYPIVVLINEDSASASELLAGALQDRDAALLVGKTTYGKASVQQLEYLVGGNAILLTVAKYFTPSGHNIDQHGIEPDFEIDMPEVLRYYRYFHPGPLEQGDYGPEVEMLQLMLEQVGHIVEVTGYFDLQTSLALTTFQNAAGINGSGEFDDQTWVELREALDVASEENDEQLNYAVELINKPGLWTIIGGNN